MCGSSCTSPAGRVTSLTYAQALDEALCVGWIDGQVKRRDEGSYTQRFTPRTVRSAWSARNVEHVARLESEGRMQAAGRAAVEAAQPTGAGRPPTPDRRRPSSRTTSRPRSPQNPAAQAQFDVLTSQNRYAFLYRLATLKTANGRARKIETFVDMLARGELIHPADEETHVSQLHDLSALEAAAAVRRREVSPVELVEHALDRIDRLDERLGAFVTVDAGTGRSSRPARPRRWSRSATGDLPPLLGVPTAIKDLNLTAGIPTKLGSRVFADFVPDRRRPRRDVAARGRHDQRRQDRHPGVRSAVLHRDRHRRRRPGRRGTRRGWPAGRAGERPRRSPAGFVSFAQGSDGGGSIRIPASVCGLVGLKPARGRISRGPLDADSTRLAVLGPLARTVRDAAAFLDVTAIAQPGDPDPLPPLPAGEIVPGLVRPRAGAAADRPLHRLPDPGRARPAGARGLGEREHPARGARSRGRRRRPADPARGDHRVRDGVVGLGLRRPGRSGARARAASAHPSPARTRPHRHRPAVRRRDRAAGPVRPAGHRRVTAHLDAVLTPTLAQLPQPVGWFDRGVDPAEDFERQKRFTPYTAMYNTTGQPAISLPLFTSREGLPIGVMLVGRPGRRGHLAEPGRPARSGLDRGPIAVRRSGHSDARLNRACRCARPQLRSLPFRSMISACPPSRRARTDRRRP